ncbi:adenosylcobinamide-GDP ribazoletransferase [Litorisediminicola beolgyonensis]|uniref:Adenosylcobinamide-GDP ribazoletransferase n=1 Tax=Litorisediminicola beolgyonensis TaxID=1173614 RepID=A0ABW3ZEG9_9RHOB
MMERRESETRGPLGRDWTRFALALEFLTRLPLLPGTAYDPVFFAQSPRFYPAVGLVVGMLSALTFWGAAQIWAAPVAAVLALGAGVWVTGGLHEDGLADCADGLGGGQSRERALEIMRDSRIGAYGVLALVFALGLRAVVLGGATPAVGAAALVLAAVVGRLAMVLAIWRLDYARAGSAKFAVPEAGGRSLIHGGAVLVLVMALAGPVLGGGLWTGLALGGAAALWMAWRLKARLGGYTGDGLGAICVLAESFCLLGVLAWV